MKVDLQTRHAVLAVGEFARFLAFQADPEDGDGGLWRARAGQLWHTELRRREERRSPSCRFEVEVSGTLGSGGWTFELSGRIDQLDTGGPTAVLREVKSLDGKLPPPDEAAGPDWLHARVQAAVYVELLALETPLRAELVLVEIATGLTASHDLGEAPRRLAVEHAAAVAELLERRRAARVALLGPPPPPPFPELRDGQAPGLEALNAALAEHRFVSFEAPTGFGKTAIVVHAALAHLRSGAVDRIVYVTAKNSGQPAVAAEFARQLRAAGAPADTLLLRSRADHCINDQLLCHPRACGFLQSPEERWPHAEAGPAAGSAHPSWGLDDALEVGRRHRVCPYDLSLSLLPWRHVWVGDCNYLVSSVHAAVFQQAQGFDPARTFLIVDEAHNLPSRTADAHGFEANASDAARISGLLDFRTVPAAVRAVWRDYADWLAGLRTCESLHPGEEDELRRIVSSARGVLERMPPDPLELGTDAVGALWGLVSLDKRLNDPLAGPLLLWAPQDGAFRLTVLDPSGLVRRALLPFARVVLQSATLAPFDEHHAACGLLSPAPAIVRAHAPWRDAGYAIAVDTRVDTRLAQRERHLPTTAATVARLHATAHGPVAVFLPSFSYAAKLQQRLEEDTPLRACLQPRSVTTAELTDFVEGALVTHDVLLLVLGGSLAEGVDLLGGRITHALVAGPALPEVNAIQQARLSLHETQGRKAAFRRVYQVPGMTKVNQALGRLVRAPGQHARVLLHCKRFADVEYASLLDPACQFYDTIESAVDLDRWLGLESD